MDEKQKQKKKHTHKDTHEHSNFFNLEILINLCMTACNG